jgi:hypothetical protein
MKRSSILLTVLSLIVAIVYFAAAELGLSLASLHSNVTAVWPPTGIAIASLLIFGRRIWPGIFVGALAANFTNFHPGWFFVRHRNRKHIRSAHSVLASGKSERLAPVWSFNGDASRTSLRTCRALFGKYGESLAPEINKSILSAVTSKRCLATARKNGC